MNYDNRITIATFARYPNVTPQDKVEADWQRQLRAADVDPAPPFSKVDLNTYDGRGFVRHTIP